MSLSISLAKGFSNKFRETFFNRDLIKINSVLEASNLPIYFESLDRTVEEKVLPEMNLTYSQLHQLRYIAAKIIEDSTLNFDLDQRKRYKIPTKLRNKIYLERKSHLICHSDFDGYYIPIDFELVIQDRELGGWLGSSIRLHEELKKIAAKLNLNLGTYTPDLNQLYEMRKQELEADPLGGIKLILLGLYNVTTASIHYNSAIIFM
ncbi:MAG: hypothetical protein HLUCCO16_11235 [Phormidium sp. OSCR]|nr:MAG: hypothetical protein HLUCCO16_11235 [Phormidium sp. OSCR]